jgi:hypothetical protein
MTLKTPEQEELDRKLGELAGVESELAQRELDLATLAAELQALERLYVRVVGVKYAELDKVLAAIQIATMRRSPGDSAAKRRAEDAQERARQSEHATAGVVGPADRERFQPSDELKRLYRDAAKKVHPDLGTNAEDKEHRNRVMAEVNRAYEEGDIDRLRRLLKEWETSPEAIVGEGVAERLVRTIRMIHQARARIRQIGQDVEALRTSDLAKLREAVRDAERQGRDLLAEMARGLDQQIAAAKESVREMGEAF